MIRCLKMNIIIMRGILSKLTQIGDLLGKQLSRAFVFLLTILKFNKFSSKYLSTIYVCKTSLSSIHYSSKDLNSCTPDRLYESMQFTEFEFEKIFLYLLLLQNCIPISVTSLSETQSNHLPFLVDDCTKKNTSCGQNALCVKGKNGVHECLCQDGYRKNGKDCDGNFRKYMLLIQREIRT